MIEITTWMNGFLRSINETFGDRVWFVGLLDGGMALLLFLPFFGQKAEGVIREVSLLACDVRYANGCHAI